MAKLAFSDLNDYIQPSQACINPELNLSDDKQSKSKPLSFDDCLACSGCVTSAETVLIQLQSFKQVKEAISSKIKRDLRVFVVSIAPQCRASLALKYSLDVETIMQKLWSFFEKQGFVGLCDTNVARNCSLDLEYKEFLGRYKTESGQNNLPMLSSSCPGWICYAEKVQPFILPFISTVKSPQQITGRFLKHILSEKHNCCPEKIYHLSIMPCFDKKLEASRKEFLFDKSPDVDCVLTPLELVEWFKEDDIDFTSLVNSITPNNVWLGKGANEFNEIYEHKGSSSGGYLHHVMHRAASEIFNIEDPQITETVGRNKDLVEYTLTSPADGTILLRMAKCYGFRNIQNIVRQMQKANNTSQAKSKNWDYIEVMACPKGCINGGGQIRSPSEEISAKEYTTKAEQIYDSNPKLDADAKVASEIIKIIGDDNVKTSYNEVKNNPMNPILAASSW